MASKQNVESPGLPPNPASLDISLWTEAFACLNPKEKSLLSSFQGLQLSSAPNLSVFSPGIVEIRRQDPGMLLWDQGSGLRRLNLLEAYMRTRGKAGEEGILVGSRAQKLIEERAGLAVDPASAVIIKTGNEELWVVFTDITLAKAWKRAISSLLKLLKSPIQAKKRSLAASMGLIFDISAIERSDERVWVNVKVTFLRETSSYEEYFLYDKSQLVLEHSCEEVLASVRDRIDPANLAILQTFLSEITLIEYEKRRKTRFCVPLVLFAETENDCSPDQESAITTVIQDYKDSSAVLRQELQQRTTTALLPHTPPLKSFFDLSALFILSTELRIAEMTQPIKQSAAPIRPAERKKSTHRRVSSRSVHQKPLEGKWYRDACDCALF